MINKTIFFSLVLIVVFGCRKSEEDSKELILNNVELNEEIVNVLDDYIKFNPLKFYRLKGKSIIESGFSYPSYHLYFNKKGMDTIFNIVLSPNYNNFELEGTTDEKGVITHQTIKHKGWLMYKDKYPLIIFDEKNYSSNMIESDELLYKIPDSLKAGDENQHIQFIKWDYKLDNGKFNKIESIGETHTHPSEN